MSLVTPGRHKGRPILLIGLNRVDIDHLIGGDIIYLEATGSGPDLGIYAGEEQGDLEETLKNMGKDA